MTEALTGPFATPFANGFPVILGTTVKLRGMTASDAPAVHELYSNKIANRFGYCPKMDNRGDAEKLIEDIGQLCRATTLFHWGIARRSDDTIVGHVTLFHIDPRHHRAEVGYSVTQREWGKGIGTEALELLVRFAFVDYPLRRLEADIDPRNTASLRIVEKLGFQREGYLRERWEQAGELQDGIFYGLLKREWQTNLGE